MPPTFLSAPPLTKYSPLGEYLTALTKFVWSYKEMKATDSIRMFTFKKKIDRPLPGISESPR